MDSRSQTAKSVITKACKVPEVNESARSCDVEMPSRWVEVIPGFAVICS